MSTDPQAGSTPSAQRAGCAQRRSARGHLPADERVILLGEDVLDPYGGAFKVTRGLSTAFPERVLTTPISEAGIVGIASGMALRGLRPVVEIMFGDFLTLAADQLINHAAKFRWMYNDQVRVPAGHAHADGRAARLRSHPQPDPGKALPGCARAARAGAQPPWATRASCSSN